MDSLADVERRLVAIQADEALERADVPELQLPVGDLPALGVPIGDPRHSPAV